MKLRVASDLHLEFIKDDKEKAAVLPATEDDKETVLILAGDIATTTYDLEYVFDVWSEQFFSVLYITGNHEYYGHYYDDMNEEIAGLISTYNNVHFLNRHKAIEIDGVVFVGDTLWTDINNFDPLSVQMGLKQLNDYNQIKVWKDTGLYDSYAKRLSPRDTYDLHLAQLQKISYILHNEEKEVVVITHHSPSEQSVEAKFKERYQDHYLNPFYYSNLEDLIIKTKPAIWIHGHMHNSVNYMVGDTLILANAYGYHKRYENENWNPKLVIELDDE